MIYKYVNVDSKELQSRIPDVSTVSVDLGSNELKNVRTLEMTSFSVPNEMYNVRTGYNTITMLVYETAINPSPSLERYDIVIKPGIYSAGQLVATIKNNITNASPFATVVPVFTFLSANNRVSVGISDSSLTKRMVLYCKGDEFKNSMLHRMGFSHEQVFLSYDFPLAKDDHTNNTHTLIYESSGVFINGVDESVWKSVSTNPLVLSDGDDFSGEHTWFNMYEHVILKSSLVPGNVIDLVKRDEGILAETGDILQIIDTHVPMYNNIQYSTNENHHMRHALPGSTVRLFSLTLADDAGRAFMSNETKAWSCVLKFGIGDNTQPLTVFI